MVTQPSIGYTRGYLYFKKVTKVTLRLPTYRCRSIHEKYKLWYAVHRACKQLATLFPQEFHFFFSPNTKNCKFGHSDTFYSKYIVKIKKKKKHIFSLAHGFSVQKILEANSTQKSGFRRIKSSSDSSDYYISAWVRYFVCVTAAESRYNLNVSTLPMCMYRGRPEACYYAMETWISGRIVDTAITTVCAEYRRCAPYYLKKFFTKNFPFKLFVRTILMVPDLRNNSQ